MARSVKIACAGFALAVVASAPLRAQQGTRALAVQVKRLQKTVQARDQVIQNLLSRVSALEREVLALEAGSKDGPHPVAAARPNPEAAAVRRGPSESYLQERERRAQAALDRTLISQGSLLVPPWDLELEQDATYFNTSSARVAINGFTILPVLVVGDIVSERVHRDIILSGLTARLGLPGRLQFDVQVPYGYESERVTTAANNETSRSSFDLGDIELGLTRQFIRGRGRAPDLLASIRWKSTTGPDPYQLVTNEATLGTGFQSLQGSVTLVKPSDPLVYFGGLSYTANFAANKSVQGLDPANPNNSTVGWVNPGDTFGFQAGLALAVNPVASLSFALDQRFTRTATFDHRPLPGTYYSEAYFRVGTSYVYSPGRTVDLGLGIGLSRDTPDYEFSIGFPFRFPLRRAIH